MERIAIFASYSKDNKIKSYVISYLTYLKLICNQIYFISDNYLDEQEKNKLKSIVSYIYANKHNEYDFGSYKIGYQQLIKSGSINKTDEIILCNDSCYCIMSLQNIFEVMSNKQCDFWGICKSYLKKEHLQSYFLVFKRNVFNSQCFKDFFLNIEHKDSVKDVIYSYELQILEYFTMNGFNGESYYSRKDNKNPYKYPVQLLKHGIPLVKVKIFSEFWNFRISTIKTYTCIKYINPKACTEILDSVNSHSFLLLCIKGLLYRTKNLIYSKRINEKGIKRIKILKIPVPKFLLNFFKN